MLQIIIGTLLAFFVLVGISQTFSHIRNFLLTQDDDHAAFVVALKGQDDQIEYFVRSLVSRAEELKFKHRPEVVLVDMGMDEQTRKIVDTLSQDINGLEVCDSTELPKLLHAGLQN